MKILYVSSMYAHGDQLSINGMINFLSFYYDKIIMLTHWNFVDTLEKIYQENHKVQSMSYDYFMYTNIKNNHLDDDVEFLYLMPEIVGPHKMNMWEATSISPKYHNSLCDDGNISISDYLSKKISTQVYTEKNPIGRKFGFTEKRIDGLDITSEYYNAHGFPQEIKHRCFNIPRFFDEEEELSGKLETSEPYAVVCEYNVKPKKDYSVLHTVGVNYQEESMIDRKYIKTDNVINLHLLSKKYFDIIGLIENATEVHLIENSITMLVYCMQLTGRMKKVPVNVHLYSRKEEIRKEYYKMYMTPKLDNWNFIS